MTSPSDVPGAAESPSLAGRDRWIWIQPVLTVVSVLLPLVCTLAAWGEDRPLSTRVIGAVAAVAFAVWSAALGPRVIRSSACDAIGLPLVFVIVQYALFITMVLTNPVYFFVAFALYWQTFYVLPLRWAIPTAILLSSIMVVLQVAHTGKSIQEEPTAALSGLLSIGFGTVMAIWISGIIEQSRERAGLIAELEATRDELAAVSHDAGALAERERLAHEIHDTLAQGFTSIVMLAQAAEAAVEVEPAAAQRHLQSIERTARDNLTEARHLVEGRGAAALRSGTLADALARLTERLAGDLGIEATTLVEGEARPLPSATEVALLRVAQEALANVRKHAGARRVEVVLRFGGGDDPAAVGLEVRDDGRGFEVDEVDHGFGVAGMRRRLEQAGGDLRVESEPGHGTVVLVSVP